ncbi:hypothetical protein [Endozoicomonas sp. Mp262]|uniref:hypothetical protein n=1 Tax=Endozoicomonas sp. Mp262 TaxID=2919499 RepID=UPI0021D9ECF6
MNKKVNLIGIKLVAGVVLALSCALSLVNSLYAMDSQDSFNQKVNDKKAFQWVKGESDEILLAAGFPAGLVELVESDIEAGEKKENAIGIFKVWFDQFSSVCIGQANNNSDFFVGKTNVDSGLKARCVLSDGLKADRFIALVNNVEKANIKETLSAFYNKYVVVDMDSIDNMMSFYDSPSPVKPIESVYLGTFSVSEFYQAVEDVDGVFEHTFGESANKLSSSDSSVDLSVSYINKTKRIYQDGRVVDQPGKGSLYEKAWNVSVVSTANHQGVLLTETFDRTSLLTIHDHVVLQPVEGWAIAEVDVSGGSRLWQEADYKTEFPQIVDGKMYHRKKLELLDPGFNTHIRAAAGNLRKYQSLREGADVYSHDFNLAWFFGEKLNPLERGMKKLETDLEIKTVEQVLEGREYSIEDGVVKVEAPRNYSYVWSFDNENISKYNIGKSEIKEGLKLDANKEQQSGTRFRFYNEAHRVRQTH